MAARSDALEKAADLAARRPVDARTGA